MTPMAWLRTLLSISLSMAGALIVAYLGGGQFNLLLSSVGVALIVAGVVGVFREVVVVRLEAQETATVIAGLVLTGLSQRDNELGPGLVSSKHLGYDEYYRWSNKSSPCDVFFAGRSILHRIHDDSVAWGRGSGDEVLARKLRDGSIIRILFLDPRSNLIDRLAHEEHRTPKDIQADLATSVGVCWRLHRLLGQQSSLPLGALFQARLYDEVPYFAYHRDYDLARKEEDFVVVGFYFSRPLGAKTAGYEVLGDRARDAFEGHIGSIFDRAASRTLLEVKGSKRSHLDGHLFRKLEQHFIAVIGQDDWQQRLRGWPSNQSGAGRATTAATLGLRSTHS